VTKIELKKLVEDGGVQIAVLTMREPTVQDQLVASKTKGDPADQEITLFANLCEVPPSVIKALTLRDYKKLLEAYQDFLD
jgi:hypothetical protein